jgi:hypothetical protein
MKPLALILAFAPLIVFSLLSRFLPHGYIGVAGLAAAVTALIAMVASRPVWPPKILSICSLVLFAVTSVLGSPWASMTTGGWPPGAAPAPHPGGGHPGPDPGHAVHRAVRPRIRPEVRVVLADL